MKRTILKMSDITKSRLLATIRHMKEGYEAEDYGLWEAGHYRICVDVQDDHLLMWIEEA